VDVHFYAPLACASTCTDAARTSTPRTRRAARKPARQASVIKGTGSQASQKQGRRLAVQVLSGRHGATAEGVGGCCRMFRLLCGEIGAGAEAVTGLISCIVCGHFEGGGG